MEKYLAIYTKDGKVNSVSIPEIDEKVDIYAKANEWNNLHPENPVAVIDDGLIIEAFEYYGKNTDTRHGIGILLDGVRDLSAKMDELNDGFDIFTKEFGGE